MSHEHLVAVSLVISKAVSSLRYWQWQHHSSFFANTAAVSQDSEAFIRQHVASIYNHHATRIIDFENPSQQFAWNHQRETCVRFRVSTLISNTYGFSQFWQTTGVVPEWVSRTLLLLHCSTWSYVLHLAKRKTTSGPISSAMEHGCQSLQQIDARAVPSNDPVPHLPKTGTCESQIIIQNC